MFAMPDAARLIELAAGLNLRLSHSEAELYLESMTFCGVPRTSGTAGANLVG